MSISDRYIIITTDFAKNHYLKRFKKDYKSRWQITFRSIIFVLENADKIVNEKQLLNRLAEKNNLWIGKLEFKIAQTNESPKSSGNRIVVIFDKNSRLAKILLIYGKTDLPKNMQEAVFIKETIKNKYPEYWNQIQF